MAKKRTSSSSTLTALRQRHPGDKLVSELTEAERREFDAATAKWAADMRHDHEAELPNWLESMGLPRDSVLAAQIALAEFGEFALPEDVDKIPMDNFYDLIKVAVAKKRWGLRVAAEVNPTPTPKGGSQNDPIPSETGDDDPIEDVLAGQLLTLYRYLKTRKRRTPFDTLAKLKCWRGDAPSDVAIEKALKRLRTELNKIPISLVIERKGRRTYLDK